VSISLFIILVAFLVDYFTMNVTRAKYKELLSRFENQQQTLLAYQNKIKSLEQTINDFEAYAEKLNIMAGLKSEDILSTKPGVGSGTSENTGNSTTSTPPNPNQGLVALESLQIKADGLKQNLTVLSNHFEEQALKLAATPTIWPTKGWVTSAFGWRNDPFTGKRAFHRGLDIATHYGNPVVATADGVVIQTSYDKIGGKTIKISHRGGYTTVYCHLSKFLVRPGQRVKRGQTIGLVGSTGKALGPHLHYEVRRNGKSLNPYYYILEEQ
jgi:murein DD-endopeptidase MepM/ murein hydrolase activator NlpD